MPVNTSLQFEFTSARAGYVTLLNAGTSGAISVHVPNTFVAPASAKIPAGQDHSVPGSHLLTRDDMQRHGLDYLEVGLPGWEHLVVIVSSPGGFLEGQIGRLGCMVADATRSG